MAKANIKQKILIIEDDNVSAEFLKILLEKEGFSTLVAYNGKDGLSILKDQHIDALLLDLSLPDMDGINILKDIYKNPLYNHISILIISGREEEIDIVIGFEFGADDYIIKPFRKRELVARIKANISKKKFNSNYDSETIKFGENEFDYSSKQLIRNGEFIKLTAKEFYLLSLFLANPNIIFTRDEILNKVWYFNSTIDTRTIDVHIRMLREKIHDEEHKFIETVRGIGYKFNI
jgi:DNA-binding response OmpR family regulator